MKYISSLLFLLFWVGTALGQTVNFEDGFEDGDFISSPTWSGDTGEFTVVNDTPNYLLQLDASTSPTYLSTSSSNVVGTWKFYVEFRGFEPSGSNQANIFLMSNIADLEGSMNGYAIQVGETGDDVFHLVRYDSGTEAATVLSGNTIVNSSGGSYTVKVSRDNSGNWNMQIADGYGGPYNAAVTGTDNTYTSASYLGPKIDFTSSRSNKFYFDFKIDLPPFDVTQSSINGSQVDITFNRPYDQSTVQASDFSIDNGIGTPTSVTFPNATAVRLDYGSTNFPSNRYNVTINNVDDQNGETIASDTKSSFVIFDTFAKGDILINEFAYDYPPTINEEYMEIKNTSDKYLDLADWEIADNSSSYSLGTDPIPIEPDSFLVVSADTTALSSVFGNRAYHEASFPALNNSSPDAVQLITGNGTTADSLTYNSDWGGTDVALERRSVDVSATYQENWGNSPNPNGGTPGIANEVAPDNTPPQLINLTIASPQTLKLGFSERLDQPGNYSITNSSITSTNQTAADTVELSLSSNLQNAQSYTLSIEGAQDLFSNTIAPIDTSFTYYKPSPVDSGDVAINEFMAAPPSNSSEYVEIYNHSDKSLNIQDWTLSDNGQDQSTITSSQFIVPPDSFVVIAENNTLAAGYPDIAMLVMSGFPALNNGGDAITIRDGNGVLLDSLSYDSDWGEDEVALERRTVDVPGMIQENWGDSPNGFGTPGSANRIETDKQPPILENMSIRSNQELLLTFSEYLDENSSENSNNFTISGSVVASARFAAPDSIFLTLEDKLQNASDYTLSIANIKDLFSNTMVAVDTSFTYYNPSPVDSGDVAINEFAYSPFAESTEYIELYNNSNKSLDIKNWTLSDNRESFEGTISANRYILPPDSFVVIAPDNTIQTDYPNIALVSMSDFPALNNGSDQIIIRDQNGTLLDSLAYTSDWGGDEVALERRSPTASSTYQGNWGDSPNPNGGTPGFANAIDTDTTPPFLDELNALNATTLQLVFSEKITRASALNNQNYSITPGRGIQLIMMNEAGNSVKLILDQELVSGESYTVEASNISDMFGNTASGLTENTTFLRIDEAQPRDIVINEIMYNPNEDQADFVEIYNASDKNINLGNWLIGDNSVDASIPENERLRAGEYLVLTGDDFFASNISNSVDVSGFPALNSNTPDAVYLKTDEGQTIDSLHYSQTWGGSEDGTSLERQDPGAASNDGSNWQTSSSSTGHTAGIKNSTYQPDSTPPEVIFSKKLSSGNIELRFNEFIQLTNNVKFLMDGQELNVAQFDSTNANVIILRVPASKSIAANGTTITVQNLSDVKGNTTTSSEVAVAQPLQPSEIVINEIMFNPLNDPDDNQADQGEYIELRNTQDHAVSLEGLYLHDAPDEDGEIRTLEPVESTAKWVPAQGKVLIHADPAPTFTESKVANFFDLGSPAMQSIMRVDRSSLSLSASDDAIFISDSTGATIDSVFYDETWHNPNIIDTRGISIERVSPTGPSNDDANWGSSVDAKGGTPHKENTIYQTNAQMPEETGISFTPNPFSPDNDGYEDNLFINYKLNQQDYLIKVRIYDRYGRLVRELADGKQAGLEGQLIWNGRKDDGSRNRIGIYIVIFEAYDSASGDDKSFKKTVVLARKLN